MLHSDMQKFLKIPPAHNLTQIQQIFTERMNKPNRVNLPPFLVKNMLCNIIYKL